jgi:hypothetical protein
MSVPPPLTTPCVSIDSPIPLEGEIEVGHAEIAAVRRKGDGRHQSDAIDDAFDRPDRDASRQ